MLLQLPVIEIQNKTYIQTFYKKTVSNIISSNKGTSRHQPETRKGVIFAINPYRKKNLRLEKPFDLGEKHVKSVNLSTTPLMKKLNFNHRVYQ